MCCGRRIIQRGGWDICLAISNDYFYIVDIHELRKIFPAFALVSEEAWTDLCSLFEIKELKRNEFLFREGDRPHHGSILLKGVLRVFYTRADGVEYNKNFFVPGMSPTPITALTTGQPCAISFQALTDAELAMFNFSKFMALTHQHASLNMMYRTILEQLWAHKEKQEIQMVTNDAITNYKIFREQFPGLEQEIPQYHIASYLGITPIQLSRIRAQMSKTTS